MVTARDEVEEALQEIGSPRYGAAVRADRRSSMDYLGVGVPELRARVKQGFSFYSRPPTELLKVWDQLWWESPYGEVLFAAIEHYRKAPKRQPPGMWEVVKHWIDRVDNWSHADALAGLYSELLERDVSGIYPQLEGWNGADGEWHRRISIVSLIHYSGKNAVFLPIELVLPLISNLLDDPRHYVQTAVGWVLREMGNVYPDEIRTYLEANAALLSAQALTRATERLDAPERTRLRHLRRGVG